MSKEKIEIIFAEDQQLMRKSLISLLSEEDSFVVTGEASNGKELLELLKHSKPDVVLLDVEMPVMNGIEALRIINTRFPEVKVIMLSMYAEGNYMAEFMSRGARGYLTKGCDIETLIEAIYIVNEEGYYFDKDVSKAMLHYMLKEKSINPLFDEQALSEREKEILKELCDGKTNKEIAADMHISVNTVDFHRGNIYLKTKSKHLADLVKYAIKHGMVTLS